MEMDSTHSKSKWGQTPEIKTILKWMAGVVVLMVAGIAVASPESMRDVQLDAVFSRINDYASRVSAGKLSRYIDHDLFHGFMESIGNVRLNLGLAPRNRNTPSNLKLFNKLDTRTSRVLGKALQNLWREEIRKRQWKADHPDQPYESAGYTWAWIIVGLIVFCWLGAKISPPENTRSIPGGADASPPQGDQRWSEDDLGTTPRKRNSTRPSRSVEMTWEWEIPQFIKKIFRNIWFSIKGVGISWWGEFSRYVSFKGKTTRWNFYVFVMVNATVLTFLPGFAPLVAGVVLAPPLLSACIRRLNDTRTSPWMVFAVPLLPFLCLVPAVEEGGSNNLPESSSGTWDRVVWNIWRLVKEGCQKWWSGFCKCLSFRGRMKRGDFLAYSLMTTILCFPIEVIVNAPFIFLLAPLLLLAAFARRMKDSGLSPWMCVLFVLYTCLVFFVPLDDDSGWISVVIMYQLILYILLIAPTVESEKAPMPAEKIELAEDRG